MKSSYSPFKPYLAYLLCFALGAVTFPLATRLGAQLPSASTHSSSQLFKHGYPQYRLERTYQNHALAFDPRTRVPWWSYERITAELLRPATQRDQQHFKEDRSFPSIHRAKLADFKHSRLHRGHMVAAGNHRGQEQALTFLLSNVCPMDPNLNTGLWSALERWIRQRVLEHQETAYVLTCALFLPSELHEAKGKPQTKPHRYVTYPVIGKSCVAVPTHLLKAALFESKQGIQIYAFVVPNQPNNRSFWDFEISREQAEQLSGLLLFRGSTQSTSPP